MLVANKTDVDEDQMPILTKNSKDHFSFMEITAKEQYNGARHTGVSLLVKISI